MVEFWKALSYASKFSALGFIITIVLGLISMGLLGAVLYYPVSFLFSDYPTLNDWHGDWVWPSLIAVGMLWSLGFVLGGITWRFLSDYIYSILLLKIIYIVILWLWAALIWCFMIKNNLDIYR